MTGPVEHPSLPRGQPAISSPHRVCQSVGVSHPRTGREAARFLIYVLLTPRLLLLSQMDESMQSQGTNDNMIMCTQPTPSPTSRSSPTKVCAMVDSLDAFKKSLVEEIEFGGILVVPLIPRMNLKLSIWLMSRVDEVSRTIYIRPGRQISFRASDVHKILGVP